jgi:serine/threonine protein kinase
MSFDLIGMTLARRYRLESILGQGGMGTVYAALDLHLGREVAVKTIREEYRSRGSVVADFVREARIIAQLASNPHILTLYDLVTTEEGNPFIVAERLRGRTLRSLILEQIRPARSWVIEMAIQVVLALADVHSRGVVHKDLKPGNVFIVETQAFSVLAKVIDFGLSHSPMLGGDGVRLGGGTPAYVAPETLAGHLSSPASDVYSLGITLYEIATGIHPYPATSVAEAIAAHQNAVAPEGPLVEGRFPEAFRRLLSAMLEKDYRNRPSIEECLARLREADRELDQSKRGA